MYIFIFLNRRPTLHRRCCQLGPPIAQLATFLSKHTKCNLQHTGALSWPNALKGGEEVGAKLLPMMTNAGDDYQGTTSMPLYSHAFVAAWCLAEEERRLLTTPVLLQPEKIFSQKMSCRGYLSVLADFSCSPPGLCNVIRVSVFAHLLK